MTRYVALLRGINVGGHGRLAMAVLREAVESLGHTDVVTYIQSGNVVLTPAAGHSPQQVADGIAAAIRQLGVQSQVVVLTDRELTRILERNPWPDETDPKHLHVVFSGSPVAAEQREMVAEAERRAREKGSADEAKVVDGTLYLRTPGGLGRSELAVQLGRLEKRPNAAPTTMRNWSTVRKLVELASAG